MAPNTLAEGTPVPADGRLRTGLTAGALGVDPIRHGSRRGRRRRWSYAAAGGGQLALGVAVVDLGPAGTAFAWASMAGRTVTWSRKVLLGRGLAVGTTPRSGASYRAGGARIEIDDRGGFEVDVPVEGFGRLVAAVSAVESEMVTPAVLATSTPGGGWNVTEKAAGYGLAGTVVLGDRDDAFEGRGWRDWTAGRQDRRTQWRWAAAGGHSATGSSVGFNVSTGMNAADEGENVVWWGGRPHRLQVTSLGPSGADPAGPWTVAGPGWSLELTPWGARAAEEDLWLLRSSYVQPVGLFRGTLPGPDGDPVVVEAIGVTEHHEATW